MFNTTTQFHFVVINVQRRDNGTCQMDEDRHHLWQETMSIPCGTQKALAEKRQFGVMKDTEVFLKVTFHWNSSSMSQYRTFRWPECMSTLYEFQMERWRTCFCCAMGKVKLPKDLFKHSSFLNKLRKYNNSLLLASRGIRTCSETAKVQPNSYKSG